MFENSPSCLGLEGALLFYIYLVFGVMCVVMSAMTLVEVTGQLVGINFLFGFWESNLGLLVSSYVRDHYTSAFIILDIYTSNVELKVEDLGLSLYLHCVCGGQLAGVCFHLPCRMQRLSSKSSDCPLVLNLSLLKSLIPSLG